MAWWSGGGGEVYRSRNTERCLSLALQLYWMCGCVCVGLDMRVCLVCVCVCSVLKSSYLYAAFTWLAQHLGVMWDLIWRSGAISDWGRCWFHTHTHTHIHTPTHTQQPRLILFVSPPNHSSQSQWASESVTEETLNNKCVSFLSLHTPNSPQPTISPSHQPPPPHSC